MTIDGLGSVSLIGPDPALGLIRPYKAILFRKRKTLEYVPVFVIPR